MQQFIGFDVSIEDLFPKKRESTIENKALFKETGSTNKSIIKSRGQKKKEENNKLVRVFIMILENIYNLKSSIGLKFFIGIGI
jgi:hypothetical protein